VRILHSKKLIFISKPRCGSTSMRRFLDIQMLPGDEKCDYAQQYPDKPEFHPHMSAPAVDSYLANKGIDIREYTTFIITRHPLQMLWSLFNYFKPDINFEFTFSQNYNGVHLAKFENWLEHGYVGIGQWGVFCPDYITNQNFSPLSLEALSNNQSDINLINKVFKLEDLDDSTHWLGSFFDQVDIGTLNGSMSENMPEVSNDILRELYKQFPKEAKMYLLNK
jgi:hypothetical protein